jgi:hypothetical protein
MLKSFLFIISVIILISACSSVDVSEKRYTEFKSNQDVELFYLSVPQMLEESGYKIESLDIEKGILKATLKETPFIIEMDIEFDKDSRNVKILTTNKITTSDGIVTEYYNLNDFNKDYEKYFHLPLSSIRSNATKTAFPNR